MKNLRRKIATLTTAAALAAGGLLVTAGPASAGGCVDFFGRRCGTVENHTSSRIWVCKNWQGRDDSDDRGYPGWDKHCRKPDRYPVKPHSSYGVNTRVKTKNGWKTGVDVDAVWIPGHTFFHGYERCIQGKGHLPGFANTGKYGLWYKFPTTCAIVVNSISAA